MKYYLAEACQNTFILCDCLQLSSVNNGILQQVHQCLLAENRDDALILVAGEKSCDGFQAQMLVLGQDGNLAEFCGNGSRACAAYLFEEYALSNKIFLLTPKGRHPLVDIGGGIYSIQLPPVSFEFNHKFIPNPMQLPSDFTYVEALEPHLIFNGSVSDEELLTMGQALNECKDLFPVGININAWEVLDDSILSVKTYERGVQRLTKSCGTGSISCAAFYKSNGNVHVQTPGGLLEIAFNEQGVLLQGPAYFWEKGDVA